MTKKKTILRGMLALSVPDTDHIGVERLYKIETRTFFDKGEARELLDQES